MTPIRIILARYDSGIQPSSTPQRLLARRVEIIGEALAAAAAATVLLAAQFFTARWATTRSARLAPLDLHEVEAYR